MVTTEEDTRCRLRSDLIVVEQSDNGTACAVIKDPLNGRVFRVSPGALQFLRALDSEALADALQMPPEPAAPADEIAIPGGRAAFIDRVRRAGLLEHAFAPGEPVPDVTASGDAAYALGGSQTFNLFHIQLGIFDPSPYMGPFTRILGPLFTRAGLAALGVASLASLAMIATSWPHVRGSLYVFGMLQSWVGIYVLLTVATLIHELGHVVACHRYGGKVHEVGFLLYMLQPAWFSNVNDAWLMPHRRDRIVVSLAGIYFEAYLACLCVAVWYFARPFSLVGQTAFVLSFLLVARMTFNLIPILRLDGYWVLSDLLRMPNLRPRAFAFLLSQVPRFGIAWRPTRPLARREAVVFVVYGSLSLLMAAAAIVTTVWSVHQVLVHAFPSYGRLIFLAVMAVFIPVSISSAVRYVRGLRGGIW